MGLLINFLIGVLSSAIVAVAAQKDQKELPESMEALENLLSKATRLRKTSDLCDVLITCTLRELPVPKAEVERMAGVVSSDPILMTNLTRWLLEPDPDEQGRQVDHLVEEISNLSGCKHETVKILLEHLEDSINQQFQLSQLRNHEKLRLILEQLKDLEDLKQIVEGNRVFLANRMKELLVKDRTGALIPVCPDPKPPSKNNSLLYGGRPTDADIDQDIDFRRTVYPEVMHEIERMAEGSLPVAFVFLADSQRGKTTFLKRVGWDLALLDYPALQLAVGSTNESYAKWVISYARELSRKPLVLMIDDPIQSREHFESQMIELYDRGAPVIVLMTSRPSDWHEIRVQRISFLQKANIYDLNPDRYEAEKLIEKLSRRGLVFIAPETRNKLVQEVSAIPFGEGYFSRVIEIVSRDDFRPIPELVDEALKRESDSSVKESFERIYTLACVPGAVGLPFPIKMLNHLTSEENRHRARVFGEKMSRNPIRWEERFLAVSHEVHATDFMKGKDVLDALNQIVEIFAAKKQFGDFVGEVLDMYRVRGKAALTLQAWEALDKRISEAHWQACSARSLTLTWGSFFYHSGLLRKSLAVNEVALEKEPHHAEAHNNYAVLLRVLRDNKAAKEHFERAVQINPDFAEPHNNYANLLRVLGDNKAAKEHYERAVQINPDLALKRT